jgi:DNA-binding MarR family transcriptional regulator
MIRRTIAARLATAPKRSAATSQFDDFLPYLIARLAFQLNTDLIEKLRREGINVTRWRILAVLAMGDGITIRVITEQAMMRQSAQPVLKGMEKEQCVRRGASRSARCVEVFLTRAAGRRSTRSMRWCGAAKCGCCGASARWPRGLGADPTIKF